MLCTVQSNRRNGRVAGARAYNGNFASKSERLSVENTVLWNEMLKLLRHSVSRPM